MPLSDYEAVIGLEVHCQLRTATKMFTACAYDIGGEPNTRVDPYTLAMPGTLPVPNGEAVERAVKFALAAGCAVQTRSRWARKHYFYPDSPKGYQITQSDRPYALGGGIDIPVEGSETARRVRLHHVHMEEDAGKNFHRPGTAYSLVDYNRCGAPLIEIVSEPDIRSAAEAAAYLREIRALVRYLEISDANMEEGTLRCDANVSLRLAGTEALGTRCEIKNLNSFKFLELAIAAEMRRQCELLDEGGQVVQSTMAYDAARDRTWVMRTKEEAADYLYFPEPDMPPLELDAAWIEAVREGLPELPAAKRARYAEAGLTAYDAGVLTADPALATYYDAVVAAGAPAKKASNWLTVELLGRLNAEGGQIETSPLPPESLAELVGLVEDGTISGRAAKEVFDKAFREGLSPGAIVERDGYVQVSDVSAIEDMVRAVLEANPAQVDQFRSGKTKVRGFFVGQVMKQSKGQANPKIVNQILDRLLAEEST